MVTLGRKSATPLAAATTSVLFAAARAEAVDARGSDNVLMITQTVRHLFSDMHHRHGRSVWRKTHWPHSAVLKGKPWRLVATLELTEEQRREVNAAAAELQERQ